MWGKTTTLEVATKTALKEATTKTGLGVTAVKETFLQLFFSLFKTMPP